MIKEKFYIEKLTSEELAETKVSNIEKLINILESNNPDSIYFLDVNLTALLEYLYEGGYNNHDIITLNNNHYGNFIRFYYLKDYDMYMMELGTC